MAKTVEEINEKIRKGQAVVFTAEKIIEVVKAKGLKKAANDLDVVTTGTFAPMCSSGAYYNVAVNLSDRVICTYMGVLQPHMRNANYCSAGQLSPLLNDPLYRTIGMGAGTLAVTGHLKGMNGRWLRGASFKSIVSSTAGRQWSLGLCAVMLRILLTRHLDAVLRLAVNFSEIRRESGARRAPGLSRMLISGGNGKGSKTDALGTGSGSNLPDHRR
jgi:uncharacterized protein (DUF39 family)